MNLPRRGAAASVAVFIKPDFFNNGHRMLRASATVLICLACHATSHAAPPAERPNVIFILVDDLGWADLGCYGSSFYDTPRLDEFAAGAVRFTNAYAASPVCSPTRAAIMTGKHPARLHITDWIPGRYANNPTAAAKLKLLGPKIHNDLPFDEVTIAETLGGAGYQTFFAGKWHLGGRTHWPEKHGFEVNRGGHDKGSPPGGYYSPYKNPALDDGPPGEYLTDRLVDESVAFLAARDQQRPFFLCLCFYTVHTPIQGCRKFDERYAEKAAQLPNGGAVQERSEHQGKTRINQTDAKYAAMVRSLDENVGRLLDALDNHGLQDDTLVVFTSDNGGLSTLAHSGPTSVLPLRAGKGWCYEGGIRVPLIIRAPRSWKKGEVSDLPVISSDFYPTILDYVGLPQRPDQHRDGVNLFSLQRGAANAPQRTLVWHYPHYHGSTWTPGSAIRLGRWKLIEFYEQDVVELYDLENDIGEQTNLALAQADRAAQLRAEMHNRLKAMNAAYPTPSAVVRK